MLLCIEVLLVGGSATAFSIMHISKANIVLCYYFGKVVTSYQLMVSFMLFSP